MVAPVESQWVVTHRSGTSRSSSDLVDTSGCNAAVHCTGVWGGLAGGDSTRLRVQVRSPRPVRPISADMFGTHAAYGFPAPLVVFLLKDPPVSFDSGS